MLSVLHPLDFPKKLFHLQITCILLPTNTSQFKILSLRSTHAKKKKKKLRLVKYICKFADNDNILL